MASEERKIRALRDAQKREENKRCADCTERLPNYVVTDFNIFVCTACSGIHREFSHRVKSVTLAIFTDEEVRAVRKGGNKVSNDLYLAKSDSLRSLMEPDDNDIIKRRNFIRSKYVDKKWYATPGDLAKLQEEKSKKEEAPPDQPDEKTARKFTSRRVLSSPRVNSVPGAYANGLNAKITSSEKISPPVSSQKAANVLGISPARVSRSQSVPTGSAVQQYNVFIPPPPGSLKNTPVMEKSKYVPSLMDFSLDSNSRVASTSADMSAAQMIQEETSLDSIWADFITSETQISVPASGNQNRGPVSDASNAISSSNIFEPFQSAVTQPVPSPNAGTLKFMNAGTTPIFSQTVAPSIGFRNPPAIFPPSSEANLLNGRSGINPNLPTMGVNGSTAINSQISADIDASVPSPANPPFRVPINYEDPFASIVSMEINQAQVQDRNACSTNGGSLRTVGYHKEGEKVEYHKNGISEPAVVLKVHFDEPNPPFYTIRLLNSDQERNTDHSHLKILHYDGGAAVQNVQTKASDPFFFADPAAIMNQLHLNGVAGKDAAKTSEREVSAVNGNPFDFF